MAGLSGKISKFLASPQGRRITGQAVRKAQQLASDPKTRAQMQRVVSRFGQQRPR
ncbi:hypothetical protein [Kineococcus glutinatus]|uniref:Antitoxin protein of toxin-antitoxin system n=1 Tax=Kineococcus glutinatus TaxID=1070872 RepID=A0ABP8VHJ0_9ACTN